MAREFFRSDRVSAQMHRELADIVRTELEDKELGMVTVSDVEVTRDLAVAKCYVSFLGASLEPRQCVKRLNELAPQIRRLVGRQMRMRVMPELRFFHDDSIERGLRMDALINSLEPLPLEPDKDADTEE
jgi:ribosome-binding factor A